MTTLRAIASTIFFSAVPLAIGCSSSPEATTNTSSNAATNEWSGKTYIIDIPDSRWRDPKGSLGTELGGFVPKFLLDIKDGDGKDPKVVFGSSKESNGKQDLCTPTTETTASAPEEQIGPFDAKLHIANGADDSKVVPLYKVTFTSILSKSADSTEGLFEAVLDVRDAWRLFNGLNPKSPESVCETLTESFETSCIECPKDSSAKYCVKMRAVGLLAKALDNYSMQTVSGSNLPSDCATGKGLE